MNGIFSFYSNDISKGRFLNNKLFLDSSLLAVTWAKRHFKHIKFYTNQLDLFKDILHLFDEVTELPYLDKKYDKFFAFNKFRVVKLQTEPFIHLDLDFFLEQINPEILNKPIITQVPEFFRFYRDSTREFLYTTKDQGIIKDYWESGLPYEKAFCTGIFGGTDLNFFHTWADFVIEKTNKIIESNDSLEMVLWLEQGLFAILSRFLNRHVYTLHKSNAKYVHPAGEAKFLKSTIKFINTKINDLN